MRTRWLRTEPEARDTLAALVVAGAVAIGAGATTFWLVRTLLAREPMAGAAPPGAGARDRGADEGGA